MNLLIARSNKFSYSETFIDNQISKLKPKILIWEGWYPSILENEKSFLPFPFNSLLVRGAFRNLFPSLYDRVYNIFFSNLLIREKIDVVLANYGPMGVSLIKACVKSKVKLYIHFHGFDATEYTTINKYGENYKTMFEKANGIIVVSNDMKHQLIKLGAQAEKIFLIPYGVDIQMFSANKSGLNLSPIFITVGRFTAKKAPLLTIKAFSKVLNEIPNAKLIMVGDGELIENAKKLVLELNLTDYVEFKGRKTPNEIVALLRNSNIFVQHSILATTGDSEGTPNSILEASSTCLPVISTYHAGIKDAVIHEKTGYLVEEGDWEKMADYMIKLGSNLSFASKMGLEARKHIEENYEMKSQIHKLKELLTN